MYGTTVFCTKIKPLNPTRTNVIISIIKVIVRVSVKNGQNKGMYLRVLNLVTQLLH